MNSGFRGTSRGVSELVESLRSAYEEVRDNLADAQTEEECLRNFHTKKMLEKIAKRGGVEL